MKKAMRKIFGMIDVFFFIMIVVVVTQLYTFVKNHQLTCLQLISKLLRNKHTNPDFKLFQKQISYDAGNKILIKIKTK